MRVKVSPVKKRFSAARSRKDKKCKVPREKKPLRRARWLAAEKEMIHFLSRRRVRVLTAFMKLMTRIGDGQVWALVILILFFVNIYAGFALLFGSVIQVILQQIIKNLFSRQRPYVSHEEISIVINPPDRFSFPSGHTAGAFVLVFFFWYFYPFLFVPMLVIATLIAFSRMYLGLHYPTDVMAGVVLGYISARLGIVLSIDVLSPVIEYFL
jgi:undecaprenyl-diphosphatase